MTSNSIRNTSEPNPERSYCSTQKTGFSTLYVGKGVRAKKSMWKMFLIRLSA